MAVVLPAVRSRRPAHEPGRKGRREQARDPHQQDQHAGQASISVQYIRLPVAWRERILAYLFYDEGADETEREKLRFGNCGREGRSCTVTSGRSTALSETPGSG